MTDKELLYIKTIAEEHNITKRRKSSMWPSLP